MMMVNFLSTICKWCTHQGKSHGVGGGGKCEQNIQILLQKWLVLTTFIKCKTEVTLRVEFNFIEFYKCALKKLKLFSKLAVSD